jgi:ribosomal protein S18 acetylase RimI-like enzyme
MWNCLQEKDFLMTNAGEQMHVLEPQVRYGTPTDASLLADLGARTFCTYCKNIPEKDLRYYLDRNFTPEKILSLLDDKDTAFLFLEMSGEPIGYALLCNSKATNRLISSNYIQLEKLYLLEKWTGRRWGDFLMAQCLEHMEHRGFDGLRLTVWEQNTRAIRFYERWGFQKVGSQDFVVGTQIQKDFVFPKNINVRSNVAH